MQKKKESNKPKSMPYKRQFSSDVARQTQQTTYSEYRQATLSQEHKNLSALTEEEKQEANAEYDNKTNKDRLSPKPTPIESAQNYNDILDPKKYKPPPSPAIPDGVLASHPSKDNNNDFVNRKESIKEDEDDDSGSDTMTDAEALQIKQNTQRALSPGTNLLTNKSEEETDEKDKEVIQKEPTMEHLEQIERTNSSHSRVESRKLDHTVLSNFQSQSLLWGYCELTRKQLDEDQAAFATWTHPSDGFVHAWAIFDGHGGYETALYSAQHFLKYVQKYHLTRTQFEVSIWPKL
eukprot:240918_1